MTPIQIQFHVYSGTRYIGGTVHAEDAAALVSTQGEGSIVSLAPPDVSVTCRLRNTLWVEGREDTPAAESYDHAAEVMHARMLPAKAVR